MCFKVLDSSVFFDPLVDIIQRITLPWSTPAICFFFFVQTRIFPKSFVNNSWSSSPSRIGIFLRTMASVVNTKNEMNWRNKNYYLTITLPSDTSKFTVYTPVSVAAIMVPSFGTVMDPIFPSTNSICPMYLIAFTSL